MKLPHIYEAPGAPVIYALRRLACSEVFGNLMERGRGF